MRRLAALLLLTAMTVLQGCSDERIIEKVGFVRLLALDAGEEGSDRIKVMLSIPKDNQSGSIIYTTDAKTLRQARLTFDRQNDRRIVNGQLREVLFGEQLATNGIWKHIDTLMRDPSIGNRAHMLLVEGDIGHLISRSYRQANTPGEYIDNLIRVDYGAGDTPISNIYTFARDYYDSGIEPAVPIIKETPSSIIIDGIALFHKDHYVAKISTEDKSFFSMLRDDVKSGDLFVDEIDSGRSDSGTALFYYNSKRKVDVLSAGLSVSRPPKIVIHLKLTGSILEYNGDLDLSRRDAQYKLEDTFARYVEKRCEAVIEEMQQAKSDAAGIGQYVRGKTSYNKFVQADWPELFAKADIRVKAKVKLRAYGKVQ